MPQVVYKGAEYEIVTDLTEREKFEAERIAGCTLNAIPGYTATLILAFFTVRRTGARLTFDAFLDAGGFEFADDDADPLGAASAAKNGSSEPPNAASGTPITPPSSESSLAT